MVVGARDKNQSRKGQELCRTEGLRLESRMAKEGHTGKVAPAHRGAGSEGQNRADVAGCSFQAAEAAHAEVLR